MVEVGVEEEEELQAQALCCKNCSCCKGAEQEEDKIEVVVEILWEHEGNF